MELVCVTVFALVSIVTATPHTYGVKGGAAAKADASAAAGAFSGIGAIPVAVPGGSGIYSGSYSKSSSSSFASSSASSSSSSFSFNGKLPGLDSNGVAGNTKCLSGSCPTGAYGPSGSGNNGQGAYSGAGANAAAAAGAGAIAFTGYNPGQNTACGGGGCSGDKPSCHGPNCEKSSTTDKRCASGQCESSSPSEDTQGAGHGSNDIFVSTSDSKSTNIAASGSGSTCTYGNCGAKPSFSASADAYPSATASINKPSTSLTTPKEGEPCTSPNCGSPNSGLYEKQKPSSYNVPANTVYSENGTPCSSGNCGSQQLNTPHSSGPTAGGCAYGKCETTHTTPDSSKSNGSPGNYPDFVSFGTSGSLTSDTGAQVTSSSKSPNYSHSGPTSVPFVNTVAAAGANAISGAYGATKTSSATSSQKNPYHGGFGGPPGFLKPNDFLPKTPSPNTSPAEPSGSIPCTSGDCGPATSGSSFKPIGSQNPAACISGNCAAQPSLVTPQHEYNGFPSESQYKPGTTPGSNKPTSDALLKPSGLSGSYNPTGPSGPLNPSGSSTPIDCSSGNCGSQPSLSPQYGEIGSHKPTGTHNPSSGAYNPVTCTTDNCGTPSSQLTPQFGPTGSYKPTNPSQAYNPAGCTSGNCHTPSSQVIPQNEPYKPTAPVNSYNPSATSGSYKPNVPAGSYSPTGTQSSYFPVSQSRPSDTQNKPASLSGASTSAGCSSSNCGTGTSFKPFVGSYNPTTSSGSSNPAGCSSGNCGSQPNIPTSYGHNSAYNPSACTSGNCGSQLSQYTPQHGHAGAVGSYYPTSSGSFSQTGCSSGNCKPSQSEQSSPLYKPTGPSEQGGCLTGNCVPQPGQIGPTGSFTPSAPSGSYKPTACASGNCGTQFGQAPTQFGPSGIQNKPSVSSVCASGNCGSQPGNSDQNGIQYKPGNIPSFGGPPGILKPNEFVKPSVPFGHTQSCTSGNCGNQPGHFVPGVGSTGSLGTQTPCIYGNCGSQPSQGQTGSHAGAVASANAIAYTGGFGGPPGLLQPFDGKGPQKGNSVGVGSAPGTYSPYGKSLDGVGTGGNSGSVAHSAVGAGAVAGSHGAGGYNNHAAGGCKDGCGSGISGAGYSGAAAKSVANAASSVNSGAYGSSFASSSASAHASAGAATKGGYGKR